MVIITLFNSPISPKDQRPLRKGWFFLSKKFCGSPSGNKSVSHQEDGRKPDGTEDEPENCFAPHNNTDTYSFGMCETNFRMDEIPNCNLFTLTQF